MNEILLSSEAAAKTLGITAVTVRKLVEQHKLKGYMVAGKLKIPLSGIDAYLKSVAI